MKYKILKISVFIISAFIGSLVGIELRKDDAEAGIELLIPYYLYIIGYIILAIFFFTYKKLKRKNPGSLVIPFFISLILLTVVPFIYSGEKALEHHLERKKTEKTEYIQYLSNLEELDNKIRHYPDSSVLYIKRGRLKRSQSLWLESLTDCEIALKKKKSVDAYWEVGWCYEHIGNLKEAKKAYEGALAMDSSINWPHERISVIERKMAEN